MYKRQAWVVLALVLLAVFFADDFFSALALAVLLTSFASVAKALAALALAAVVFLGWVAFEVLALVA